MKNSMIGVAAFAMMLSGAAYAEVTTKTTTTWTNEQGAMIREHSVVKHYNSFNDPKAIVKDGFEVPASVNVYPLPDTIKVEEPARYSYVIINDKPVVIERTSRRVIHTFE